MAIVNVYNIIFIQPIIKLNTNVSNCSLFFCTNNQYIYNNHMNRMDEWIIFISKQTSNTHFFSIIIEGPNKCPFIYCWKIKFNIIYLMFVVTFCLLFRLFTFVIMIMFFHLILYFTTSIDLFSRIDFYYCYFVII